MHFACLKFVSDYNQMISISAESRKLPHRVGSLKLPDLNIEDLLKEEQNKIIDKEVEDIQQ